MVLRHEVRQVAHHDADWWPRAMERMVRCQTVYDLLDCTYDTIRDTLGFDRVNVLLTDPLRGVLVKRIITNKVGRKVHPPDATVDLGNSFYGAMLADPRMRADGPGFLYGPDAALDGVHVVDEPPDLQPSKTLYVALRTPRDVIGLLCIARQPGSRPVTALDAPPLVALATALAPAIDNALHSADRSHQTRGITEDLRRRVAELERTLERMVVGGERRGAIIAPGGDFSETDAVTGLLNHRALLERLDDAVLVGMPFTLLLLDVDNFRLFNETHGHTAGDRVLRRLAELLRHAMGDDASAGRYAADEIAIILQSATGQKARAVVRRLDAMVRAQPHTAGDGTAIPISVSTGIACYPADGRSRQRLLASAERALYAAKRGRRLSRRVAQAPELLGDTQAGVLNGLVTAVDSKDRYTREHSEDVTRWALLMAESLGLGADERRALALAGPLHDVGKIAVPDRVLRKPGRLTRDEHEIMRHHVSFGVALIQGVLRDPAVVEAVAQHHERWDGRGYPNSLRGLQASLLGRIMQVADAVSAMRLNRPYRQGLPWARVIGELRAGAGSQFDPELVEPFIAAAGHVRQ